jgi:hypothetical protein
MPYTNIGSGAGGVVGIAALIRSVIQDVTISNKRPNMETRLLGRIATKNMAGSTKNLLTY